MANGVLYAVPWLGRAAWENVTPVKPPQGNQIAILVGDDRGGAPLLLYLGQKKQGGFLERNGLAEGQLYVWVADNGETTPEQFNGTGNSRSGTFVEIAYYNPALAGTPGYDNQGFADQATQDALAAAAGAFQFSRPEDLATNPKDKNQVVLASTGRSSLFPSDNWGTTYLIDVAFPQQGPIRADVHIIYDGDDAGAGQFAHPDFGMRSPDNLDWADNGLIYLQEDRSTGRRVPKDPAGCAADVDPQACFDQAFGGTSGMEASIWELDPDTGLLTRILMVDRTVIPAGQTDNDPLDLGDWETSGVLDVTKLFKTDAHETLLIADVQAHSLRCGPIDDFNLVQGGQLVFLSYQPTGNAPAAKTATTSQPSIESGPNPFNPSTQIHFSLPVADVVTLEVFNLQGQKVATLIDAQPHRAGRYAVEFNAAQLASGIYFYQLRTNASTQKGKMTLLR